MTPGYWVSVINGGGTPACEKHRGRARGFQCPDCIERGIAAAIADALKQSSVQLAERDAQLVAAQRENDVMWKLRAGVGEGWLDKNMDNAEFRTAFFDMYTKDALATEQEALRERDEARSTIANLTEQLNMAADSLAGCRKVMAPADAPGSVAWDPSWLVEFVARHKRQLDVVSAALTPDAGVALLTQLDAFRDALERIAGKRGQSDDYDAYYIAKAVLAGKPWDSEIPLVERDYAAEWMEANPDEVAKYAGKHVALAIGRGIVASGDTLEECFEDAKAKGVYEESVFDVVSPMASEK